MGVYERKIVFFERGLFIKFIREKERIIIISVLIYDFTKSTFFHYFILDSLSPSLLEYYETQGSLWEKGVF